MKRLAILSLISILMPHLGAQSIPAAVPMPTPEVQYFSSNGRPMAGGKLCTYAAGTSTPLATYTDSTAGTPNTNPVTLDVAGRASVWIGPQLYKFVLKSGGTAHSCADGTVQWTQDNVSDTTLYFVNYIKNAGTATLITYTAPFTGAIQRTVSSRLSERVSVKDYGATGDGATDDSTAIQNALDQVCTGGAATGLYFPAGRYEIGTLLTCTITGGLQGVHFYGDGPQTTLESTGTNGILEVIGSDGISQDRVFFDGGFTFTGVANTAFGLKMTGVAGYGLTDINSDTILKGIWLVASQQGYIKGGVHLTTAKGLVLDGHISVPLAYWIGSNAADVSGVSWQTTVACVEISGAADAFIHGNHCTTAAIGAHFVTAVGTVNVGNIVLDSNHYEVNATAAIKVDAAFVGVMITISNSSFFNAGDEMILDGTVSTRVLNNAINGDVTMETCFNVCQFIGNKVFAGHFVDTTGLTMAYNNKLDAHPINHSTFWKDPAEWTFPSDSIVPAGDVAIFTGNPLISGNWGINVPGVGTASNYAYLLLHNYYLKGSLGGNSLILESPGGVNATFTPGQTTINGQIYGKARLLSLGVSGSAIARIGMNRDTQAGANYDATGNAFELDVGDVADSFVINRYNHAGTLVGIDFESDINRDTILPRKVEAGAVTFTGLSTGLSVAGTFVYCTNCNIASPCTTGGSGAWAFRSGATWKCPF